MPPQEKPKIVSRGRRRSFVIGGEEVRPGTIARLELPVARALSGALLSLPVAVLHGEKKGPVIWLSAAIHGDELNGIPIIRRVINGLSAQELRGTVIAVPIVNVFGLIEGSRYLPDRRDLNRSFPGSKRGSLAAQLAHLFMEQIVGRCEVGIDLHTGAAGRTNLPQVRCNLADLEAARLARAFAAPVTLDAPERGGSLRGAAGDMGVPVLLYEGGEAGRFNTEAIETGVEGIMRVMAALAMIDKRPHGSKAFVCRSSSWLRARRSGFCEMRAQLGQRVAAGETIAAVFDSVGKSESLVRANADGIVIGCISSATVYRGDAVAHVAFRGEKPRRKRSVSGMDSPIADP